MANITDVPGFINDENFRLATKTAHFLAIQGYGCAIMQTDDRVCTITYAKNRGEGELQPTIRVEGGKLAFPKGSDFDLLMSLLGA